MGAVDPGARYRSASVCAAVVEAVDVAILESGDGEVAPLVEVAGAAQAQHGAARTGPGHLLPGDRLQIGSGRRAAREEQGRGEEKREATEGCHPSTWNALSSHCHRRRPAAG